jgi:hypothetical protein
MYKLSGDWTGAPTTPRVQTTTYTLTDPNDGATATATYELILHDAYEAKSTNPVTQEIGNIRSHPHHIPVRASTNGQTLTVGVSASYTWTIGMSLSGEVEAAQFASLGLGVEVSKSVTSEANASASAENVPAGWEMYLQIYDRYDVHSGVSYKWLPEGYGGEVPWVIKAPSVNPSAFGVQAAPPYPIDGGSN